MHSPTIRRLLGFALPATLTLGAVSPELASQSQTKGTLLEARKGHSTKLLENQSEAQKPEEIDPALGTLVSYQGPLGPMSAYVSKPPAAGRHPAILWIVGGFPSGGSPGNWTRLNPGNDQSARAFRDAGIVTMFPNFRGVAGNPGRREYFYGEVDDALAALDFLRKHPSVDPERVYVGGHSTGGTMALLVAECTDRVAGVFSFGPVADPADYGQDNCLLDVTDPKERRLRAPIEFLDSIRSPTWVIEGVNGNSASVRRIQAASDNKRLTCITVQDADHFDLLYPIQLRIAAQIRSGSVRISQSMCDKAVAAQRDASREAADLKTISSFRRLGGSLTAKTDTEHFFWAVERERIEKLVAAAEKRGWTAKAIEQRSDEDDPVYFVVKLICPLRLGEVKKVFAADA